MQTYKYRADLCVGHGRAVIKRRIFIGHARLYHLKTLRFESATHLQRKLQNNFTFSDSAGSARSCVCAAVRGIEHNDVQSRTGPR
jgi:hypothetical protein